MVGYGNKQSAPPAPFFESAGGLPNFLGTVAWQQGNNLRKQHVNKVIMWESLSAGEKKESLEVPQKEKGWVICCKSNPNNKGKQQFREHSQCIFTGRCKESKRDRDHREEVSRGKHVTRVRIWWKHEDVLTCAAQTNMESWVHQDIIMDHDKAHKSVKEAWEHEEDKDKLKIELQGLERQLWLGTEAGRLG
jgi:hypothetical protein